ncbi:MAG: response regulator [Kiritimatiellae bacterium]|nr:response regulator [Kiritimatiellia bacterium]
MPRVLIVDDEPAVLTSIARVLARDARFETRTATRGLEALDLAAAESYDAIICDIVLPDMDGNAVVAEMKQRRICPPLVVMVSGIVRADPRAAAGDTVFLRKPINGVQLLSLLQSRLVV